MKKKNQEIVLRSNTLMILSFHISREHSRSNALMVLACQIWEDCLKVQRFNDSLLFKKKSKDHFKVQHLKRLLFATKIISKENK